MMRGDPAVTPYGQVLQVYRDVYSVPDSAGMHRVFVGVEADERMRS
jgi:hypothetical protein